MTKEDQKMRIDIVRANAVKARRRVLGFESAGDDAIRTLSGAVETLARICEEMLDGKK